MDKSNRKQLFANFSKTQIMNIMMVLYEHGNFKLARGFQNELPNHRVLLWLILMGFAPRTQVIRRKMRV